MQTFTIEVSIPDELRQQFEARLKAHGGDTRQYVQEVIARDLFAMSNPARQHLIDETFEKIDQKYGEALRNLARGRDASVSDGGRCETPSRSEYRAARWKLRSSQGRITAACSSDAGADVWRFLPSPNVGSKSGSVSFSPVSKPRLPGWEQASRAISL